MNPVEIAIPENIEELIEAYLRQQAARLEEAGLTGHECTHLGVSLCGWAGKTLDLSSYAHSKWLDGKEGRETTSLAAAVSARIQKVKDFDPIAEKKAERDKLDAEIAALEGGKS